MSIICLLVHFSFKSAAETSECKPVRVIIMLHNNEAFV